MQPIVHGLEPQYEGRIDFLALDIDDPKNADAKAQLRFRYQPQFVLLTADGQVVKTWIGAVTTEEFVSEFTQFLGQ